MVAANGGSKDAAEVVPGDVSVADRETVDNVFADFDGD
jgi:hypothetical protein